MEVLKMTDLTINIKKTIHAPIEKVFDAWLNPKMLSKFMMPMPGMPESDVENDARKGGNFTIIMHAGDDKLPHTGEYLEIVARTGWFLPGCLKAHLMTAR